MKARTLLLLRLETNYSSLSLLHLTLNFSFNFSLAFVKLVKYSKFSKDDLLTVEILEHSDDGSRQSNQFNSIEKTEENSTPQAVHKRQPVPIVSETAASVDVSSDEDEIVRDKQQVSGKKNSSTLSNTKFHHGSKGALPSPLGSAQSFDLQVAGWRMEKLEVDSKSGSEEEFYDCLGEL